MPTFNITFYCETERGASGNNNFYFDLDTKPTFEQAKALILEYQTYKTLNIISIVEGPRTLPEIVPAPKVKATRKGK